MKFARVLCAAGLILMAGLVHGNWTNRWGASRILEVWASRLQAVPTTIGDWSSRELPRDAAELRLAGAVGALSRRYENRLTGESVTTLLLVGLPGDIGAHTPDICFPGAGLEVSQGGRMRLDHGAGTGSRPAIFQTAIAQRDAPTGVLRLRVLWGWNDSQGWDAPDHARWKYAASPALWKLYIVHELTETDVPASEDSGKKFLEHFLPVIDRVLFALTDGAVSTSVP